MAHPSKVKGDRHELATLAALTKALAGTGLTVEKTRAGYERDGGDLHILTPDRAVLFVVQCKDVAVNRWAFPEWLRDLAAQRETAHCARGFLSVKRSRVLDAAQAYAVADMTAMAALVVELWRLRRIIEEMAAESSDSRERLRVHAELFGALAEAGVRVPVLPVDTPVSTSSPMILNGDGPDPDVIPDEPGTVRGPVVYPWRRPAAR